MAMFDKLFFVGAQGGGLDDGERFPLAAGNGDAWQPAADILETDDGFLVQVDLPGVEASSIEVMLEGRRVFVRGVRRLADPGRGKRYVHMEISRGAFGKAITLPAPAEGEGASCSFADGVLEIRLPRSRGPAMISARLHTMTIT
jgi:HSP20 family protein